ncbi:MAG: HD-GYP domain-containing protein [Bdellovibrionales bacterium]
MSPTENDFIPIRVSTLRGDQPTLFDVFVRVAGKHILYCRQGDSFDETRLERLKEKKIKQLFIRTAAETYYRAYLSKNIDLAYRKSAGKPIETRAQIVQGLQQAATEDVLENPDSKIHYEVFKTDTGKYVEFVLQEDQALKCVLNIKNDNSSVAHHGVNVASLAISLATHLGHKETSILHLLATGCLLHDIEHMHSGLDINRPLGDMTPQEIDLYRKHSDAGVARVQETKFYDQLVLKIMRFHHEQINGSGFPDKLKEADLHPMVLIASVADSYDRLITYEGITPKEAVKKLLIDKVGLHPLSMIQGLAALLKQKGVV